MIPWKHLDTAPVPGGEGELRLMQRGSEFSIMLGGNELMNSRLVGSEKALAGLVCDCLSDRPRAKMLIGGLGMGFTLREALVRLGPDAAITVAELVPQVIAWARGPMREVFGDSLDDQRVRMVEGDVGGLIRGGRSAFDAILLDVDNGPEGFTREANDALYDRAGLAETRDALRPRGVLAVWSCAPDQNFARRLRQSGFAVEEKRVRARSGGGGARHVIWLATRG